MPAIRKIVGPRGPEYWKSFNPEDSQTVAEALKEEFRRSEPASDIHYAASGSPNISASELDVKIRFHCFRHCLIFLLRGAIFIDGQGALVEPGFAYLIKNEEWIGLGGKTTVFVMEEGEMKGICAKKAKEAQERYRAEKEAAERRRKRPWNRVRAKFRREPEPYQAQCPTQ